MAFIRSAARHKVVHCLAAGKGTASALVCEKYNIPHISTGDLLRDEIANQTKLGVEIKDAMARGEFVSDEVITKLLKKRLSLKDAKKGYILDGRDIGSVVLPDAEVKIFQTASIESRAKRRLSEYVNKGIKIDYQTIYDEIKLRDYQDQNREHSPLIRTQDAYLLDTSELSIDESVEFVYNLAIQKMNERSG